MSRRALPADAALARTAPLGWAASRGLSWPRHPSDYVLTTLGVVAAAGLLFWRQPALLSAPFDGVFTYLNMAQTHRWQPPGQPLGGYYPLEGMGSRLMPSVPALLPHAYAVWLVGDPALRVWLAYLILTGLLALGTLAYFRAAGVSRGASIAATALTVVLAATQSDLIRATREVLCALVGMMAAPAIFLQVGRRRARPSRSTPTSSCRSTTCSSRGCSTARPTIRTSITWRSLASTSGSCGCSGCAT